MARIVNKRLRRIRNILRTRDTDRDLAMENCALPAGLYASYTLRLCVTGCVMEVMWYPGLGYTFDLYVGIRQPLSNSLAPLQSFGGVGKRWTHHAVQHPLGCPWVVT